jgi:hypothetical protein
MKKNFWRFADSQARSLLGPDPMQHFKDAVIVKSNPVREVWRTGEFFFKFDKRPCHGFTGEFSRACALHDRGIPVVRHLACGRTELGNCLITRSLPDSRTVDEFIRGRVPDEDFLNGLINFLKLIERRKIIHRDLHFGNVLYVEKDNYFSLVDVRDARPARWYDFFLFSRLPQQRLIMELMENLPTPKLCGLLRKTGVDNPEVFIEQNLELKARRISGEWQRRREQVLTGYPKFTRREGELLIARGVSLSELENAEKIPGNAGIFAGAFYLDLVRIPHRRILAWSEKENMLWAEPLVTGDPDSALVADLRSRALTFGINSACTDWVYDVSGLVKLSVWKEM